MPESPPLNTPYSVSTSPEVLDDLIVETVDSENAPSSYIREPVGLPQQDQLKYPGYIYLGQRTVSPSKVQRYWSTPGYSNQDVYNVAFDYVAESTSHPIYLRTYKTRRDQYQPVAALSVLTGVWRIKVENPGTGYSADNPPTVTIGGPGTGATAVALVNPDGTIGWIRITSEGSNYTATPTVTIAPPASGTTATATATVQAGTAVMVSQKTQQFDEGDPRFSLFLIEVRAYKTLPGPPVPQRGFRPDGTMILHTEKDVVATTMPDDGPSILSSTMQALNSIEGKLITEQLTQADGVTPIIDDEGYVLFHTEQRTNAMLGTILRLRPYDEALPAVGGAAPLGSGLIIDTRQVELKNSTNVIQAITVKPFPTAPKYDFVVDKRTGVLLKVTEYDDTAEAGAALAEGAYGTGVMEIDVSALDTVQCRIRISQTASGEDYPPVTVSKQWDDIVRGSIWETHFYTTLDSPEPEPGEEIEIDGEARIIVDFDIDPYNQFQNITKLITIPKDKLLVAFTEYIERAEQKPGIFQFLVPSFSAPTNVDLDRPGFIYNYDVPESGKYIHQVEHYLINGGLSTVQMPVVWNGVTSPAAATSIFRIRANTIHPAFEVWDSTGAKEKFVASTPSFYRSGTSLLVSAPCVLWRGTIFRLSLYWFNDRGFSGTPITPKVLIQKVTLPKSSDGGFNDPADITRLVYDGEANDNFIVFGTSNGAETSESVEIRHYGPVRGDVQWNLIYSIRMTSYGSATPLIRATGTKPQIRFQFSANPERGDTWNWQIVGAQYGPVDYGYEFVNVDDWFTVSGGATLDGVNVDGEYYARDLLGVPYWQRLGDDAFGLYPDGGGQFRLDVPSLSSNYFTGGGGGDPATTAGAYSGTGTTTGTPVVTLIPAMPLTSGNRIKWEPTLAANKATLVLALNNSLEVNPPNYHTSIPVPFFDGETAVDSPVTGRIVLTDHVANIHTITYTGTAPGAATYIDDGGNGAKVAEGVAGEDQYRYNAQDLYNQDRNQIIPPNLSLAETKVVDFYSQKDIQIRYVMSPEITLEYQINSSGAWVVLDTITGDDLATEDVANVNTIKFRITNSAGDAKMLRLFTQWSSDDQ